MELFEDDGQYLSVVQLRSMGQYIVLDFTVMRSRKRCPGITALPPTWSWIGATRPMLANEQFAREQLERQSP